jgi:cytochrome c oxidase accessory protein FixG
MAQAIPKEAKSAAAGAAAAPAEDSLYEVRKKIYPRAVHGWFAGWRWALVWFTQLLFYGLCWLEWNGRQAVLFHLVERKFYIFGWVFWPQDVFYLAILLIISAYALFLFTAIAGRLWCGFACPQTVYTEMFLWLEEKIEGTRSERMKLDAQPMGPRKLALKSAKIGVWVLVSFWTGFTFVGYFSPIKELWQSLVGFTLGPWETFWILFYGGWTYVFAGHLREQVCKYMCPYARFQGVMFDPDTLVITYDQERGEPRGPRNKKLDYKAAGLGDCVDCGICVQVCPTGIDIRQGLQYECIGCAACIDACDQVMDKVGYPQGLIRYSTQNALQQHWGAKEIAAHVARPRVLIYSSILIAITIAMFYGLATRIPLKVNVIRDRATLAREVEGGKIENVYRLKVMNTAEQERRFSISASGLDGIEVASAQVVSVPAATTQNVPLSVRVPAEAAARGSHKIYFEIRAIGHEDVFVREQASFLMP